MSEPMTTHEIEDVLSSIRRLVSDDLRPVSRESGPEPGAATIEKPPEKLLLTPALRVVGRDEAATGPRNADPIRPDAPVADTLAPTVFNAGEVVTRLGSGVAEDDWESPIGDIEDWPRTGWGKPKAFTPDTSAGLQFVHRTREGLENTLAAAPAADINVAPEVVFSAPDELQADPGFVEVATKLGSVSGDDSSELTDEAEADAFADLSHKVEQEAVATVNGPDGDAMLFDEEVLRNLVRDLIREELAGSLGERITRNVRKLVRAEIARALTVQDVE